MVRHMFTCLAVCALLVAAGSVLACEADETDNLCKVGESFDPKTGLCISPSS